MTKIFSTSFSKIAENLSERSLREVPTLQDSLSAVYYFRNDDYIDIMSEIDSSEDLRLEARKVLFSKILDAIEHKVPRIESPDLDQDTIDLAIERLSSGAPAGGNEKADALIEYIRLAANTKDTLRSSQSVLAGAALLLTEPKIEGGERELRSKAEIQDKIRENITTIEAVSLEQTSIDILRNARLITLNLDGKARSFKDIDFKDKENPSLILNEALSEVSSGDTDLLTGEQKDFICQSLDQGFLMGYGLELISIQATIASKACINRPQCQVYVKKTEDGRIILESLMDFNIRDPYDENARSSGTLHRSVDITELRGERFKFASASAPIDIKLSIVTDAEELFEGLELIREESDLSKDDVISIKLTQMKTLTKLEDYKNFIAESAKYFMEDLLIGITKEKDLKPNEVGELLNIVVKEKNLKPNEVGELLNRVVKEKDLKPNEIGELLNTTTENMNLDKKAKLELSAHLCLQKFSSNGIVTLDKAEELFSHMTDGTNTTKSRRYMHNFASKIGLKTDMGVFERISCFFEDIFDKITGREAYQAYLKPINRDSKIRSEAASAAATITRDRSETMEEELDRSPVPPIDAPISRSKLNPPTTPPAPKGERRTGHER